MPKETVTKRMIWLLGRSDLSELFQNSTITIKQEKRRFAIYYLLTAM
jgi:hypothetical protein